MRSCQMMGFGTILVLIFSDPMVDVLSEIGVRTDISAFYISFVLAPLASNASELLAAYNYAAKRTSKTMTTSIVLVQFIMGGVALTGTTMTMKIGTFVVCLYPLSLIGVYILENVKGFD